MTISCSSLFNVRGFLGTLALIMWLMHLLFGCVWIELWILARRRKTLKMTTPKHEFLLLVLYAKQIETRFFPRIFGGEECGFWRQKSVPYDWRALPPRAHRSFLLLFSFLRRRAPKRDLACTMMTTMLYRCWVGLWLILVVVSSSVSSEITMTTNTTIGVGFGTAALGNQCYPVVQLALQAGFRKFDTAEADWWYDQAAVGRALQDYFTTKNCQGEDLRISTKIPPWSLTSIDDIRHAAARSRQELVGFCQDQQILVDHPENESQKRLFPLDVYYIHAPECWKGWHPRCDDNNLPILPLRQAWLAMEAVIQDGSARRIGLSNIQPHQLLDIIQFVQERPGVGRMPDVVQAFADPIQPSNELRRICQEHFIEFVSYSTLGTQHRQLSNNRNPVLTHPIVVELSNKYQRSVAEVVLSWALQHDMSVIPRSSNAIHIQELARLLEDTSGFLEPDDVAQIDTLENSIL